MRYQDTTQLVCCHTASKWGSKDLKSRADLEPALYTEVGEHRSTGVSTQNTELILVLLFINYCVVTHANNGKPTLAHPCIYYLFI